MLEGLIGLMTMMEGRKEGSEGEILRKTYLTKKSFLYWILSIMGSAIPNRDLHYQPLER